MGKRNIFVGDWFESNNCGRCQVIKYTDNKNILVRFERSGIEKSFSGSQLKESTISDKIFKEIKIGDKFVTNLSGIAEVIELLPKRKVVVKFEDGTLKTCNKSLLQKGSVYNGSCSYTQEEAIKLMTEKYSNLYSYEKTIFKNVKTKFTATCSIHGDFTTCFDTHYNGSTGCPSCGYLRTSKKKTKPKDLVFKEIYNVHGDLYDYSKSIYKNNEAKIEIICKEHGSFWQSPEKHKTGQKCPECSDNTPMTTKKFIEKLPEKHVGVYSYELISEDHFQTSGRHVPIVCKIHGVFIQHYRNHLKGSGCTECARFGFNTGKEGKFYVLSDENRVKVGITNRDVEARLSEINRKGMNFKIKHIIEFENGKHCADLETYVLRFMRDNYKNSEGDFDGVTESFDNVDLQTILNEIENIRRINGI